MHRQNWDDLRYVLAVAEAGTISGAARDLGVNHATVLRRVAAFEDHHGTAVFHRTATGYQLREDHVKWLDAARRAENAMLSVERLLRGADMPLRGEIRLTSTDSICTALVPGIVKDIQLKAPELSFSLLCSNRPFDLARMQADVTIRPTTALPDDLTGEVAAKLGFAVYGAPDGPDTILVPKGPLERSEAALYLAEKKVARTSRVAADSFLVLQQLARQGLGMTVLPCYVGDADPGLVRHDDLLPRIEVDLWVASHVELADAPRIVAARRLLAECLAARAQQISGYPA